MLNENNDLCVHGPSEYLDEAQLLLAYAAQNGLDISPDVVAVIVRSRHAFESNRDWTPEIESEFWLAFNKIAKLVAPVSVGSLKATHALREESSAKTLLHIEQQGFWKRLLRGKMRSTSEQTVNFYQKWSFVVLAILLVVQVYWLIGSTATTNIEQANETIDTITKKMITLQNSEQDVDFDTFEQLDAQLNEQSNHIDANFMSLQEWHKVWRLEFFSNVKSDEGEQGDAYSQRHDILLQESILVLTTIQLYVLPLLYGLLGAFAYVLRTLTIEIRSLTYTVESNIRYRLRIQLGALTGLAVGWFTDSGTTAISLSSLSPLALAFLAGYSVEVLFAMMDRLIAAFSTSSDLK